MTPYGQLLTPYENSVTPCIHSVTPYWDSDTLCGHSVKLYGHLETHIGTLMTYYDHSEKCVGLQPSAAMEGPTGEFGRGLDKGFNGVGYTVTQFRFLWSFFVNF